MRSGCILYVSSLITCRTAAFLQLRSLECYLFLCITLQSNGIFLDCLLNELLRFCET